ncbi:MAG: 50S ribosomal protein L13 [bacterium]
MKTYTAKPKEMVRKWYLVDAKDQTLGRISVIIADLLRGKNKPIFTPHVDCGDYVIVINTKYIKLTGNKLEDKKYYRHSGYPGGLTTTTLSEMLQKAPNKVIYHAVKGMLPKNKLASEIISKLKLFADEDHSHIAQKPIRVEKVKE